MKAFRRLSIRSKLAAMMALTALLALLGGFAFVVATQVATFEGEMVANTALVARVIADYSVSDLAFGDRAAAEKTLDRLRAIPSVQFAYLYDASGEVFATYGDPRRRELHAPPSAYAPEFRDGALHVTQPVTYQNEKYGTIHLCASTAELDRRVRGYLLTMLLGMAALAGGAFLAAMRLQGLISRPILDLAGLVRKVSETHDYSLRARKEGEDEIGSLADGVNEMLSRIQERELERDLADRRTREKSRFLANMSHELRTPLNSIIGFSEVLISRLQDRVPAKDLKFLRNIHGSGQHLLAVVNDILDISKVEAGTMEVRPAALSVRAVIEGVRQVMKGLSARRSVAVAVEVPDDLPPLEADPEKLKQVLYHLLSNAVKFSPFGGTVTLRARLLAAEASPLGEEAVAISVADQGPGIDPRDHELIFQEFRQVESGSPIEGSGLGLSIVKKFVELHGGRVTVDSALGRGATFTAVLPRRFRSRGTASGAPPGAAAAGAS